MNMPLDTGGLTGIDFRAQESPLPAAGEPVPPSLRSGDSVGAALRAVREFKGLSVEQVAADTRVRRAYLTAIEDMRFDALPSRPFTIGYIRAYAAALGLDGAAAVERFRDDSPDPDQSLRGPVGVDQGRDPRMVLMVVAGALVIAAIVIWNVAQRILSKNEPPPPPIAAAPVLAPAVGAAPAAPFALGGPLPAPVESTTPPPYETPGLQAATAKASEKAATERGDAPPAPSAAVARPAPPPADLAAAYTVKGEVYGAPAAESSSLILQARKAATLVVRGPDGSVYFARQLTAGEAYRVPALAGLVADVAEADSVQVFSGGASRGLLPSGVSPVSKFGQ